MEVQEITALISNVGFPIVCVMFMWKYISASMTDFTKSLTEVTVTLNKICDRLDDLERKINDE